MILALRHACLILTEIFYGKKITVEFYEYIRHEKKISGLDELKNQMEKDKERAETYIKKINS